MFLLLNHKNLDVYKAASELVNECYAITKLFPAEERYNLTSQIRRAALSVKLNIAEGSSRRSVAERNRYYEIARGSVIEIDAAIETCVALNYLQSEQLQNTGSLLNKCFSMLTKLAGYQ